MNDLPNVTGIVAEVQERFSDRMDAVRVCRRDEIYFDAKMDLVAGFSGHLYKKWGARLVSVFADDVRDQENVFHLYYVYALAAARALIDGNLDAEAIVRRSLEIAADICIYTNRNIVVETIES